MRVFVTGATGFIGSAVVKELIHAGHEVVGLARSDKAAAALHAMGAEALRGSLGDPNGLRSGAAEADGVIHLAFDNSFTDFAGAIADDLQAIEVIGDVLAGSGKPIVMTSVTTMVPSLGRPATEDDQAQDGSPGLPRSIAENMAIALAARDVRSSAVRLAPCVHDATSQGFATLLAELARQKGVSAYVGDGANHWPALHRLDAAKLYRLALESAPAGSRLHGAGEEAIPFRNIAEAIGQRLNLPVSSISPEAAEEQFGWLAPFVLMDNPTSNVWTREKLGWEPAEPTLVADILGK
ncbi:3-beta hydroxysteroid dehydrogenase [Paenibacillus riograndensis]|uniref:3-beta hydroxysteroid dehydrogenase n=1 Tax=Paenibacillus riograndensis TaxID=483937 RepID=A0A132TRW0_9BACL|nr:SDR family oxidoreductase [Paenibacillus riograndensis]KWX74069.1 3-beta hydroxysteroid dehydrogenase [Paenibacillus riograndensis]